MSGQIRDYIYGAKPLGRGAFSTVYKGLQTKTDTIVAIKEIYKASLQEAMLKYIYQEAEILKALDHPNIINLYEVIEDMDYIYFILEYCPGGDLKVLLQGNPIDEALANDYLRQLASALKYLCEKNLVHRDLKPQNILLNKDRTVLKLTDFSFVRELTVDSLAQTICGSPLYMAPEIMAGSNYTTKADLWSIGIIMYELLYGRSPFWKARNMTQLLKIIQETKISFDNDSITPEARDLLQQLLCINPQERATWEDFFDHSWLQPKRDSPDILELLESIALDLDINPPSLSMSMPVKIPKKVPMSIIEDYKPPRHSSEPEIRGLYRARAPIITSTPTPALITTEVASSAPKRSSTEVFSSGLWYAAGKAKSCLSNSLEYIKETVKANTFGKNTVSKSEK